MNYKYYKNMDFATEIREAFEKKYVKVFLKESDDIELVKSTLERYCFLECAFVQTHSKKQYHFSPAN